MVAILFAAFSLIFFFIYRKMNLFEDDTDKKDGHFVKSPINGKVVSIYHNVDHKIFGDGLLEVGLIIPHFYEMGLYLPFSAEIESIKRLPSRKFFRYKKRRRLDQKIEVYGGENIIFFNKRENFLGLQMIKCFLGLSPKIWVMPGDMGRVGARFGQFPLGGSVLCYLSQNYELMVKKGDSLRAGKTILAKEKIEN
ncbi:MAG: hypothetical protein OXB88_11135 [Bacteriovoracales bacterium]|nr:hypothetical protein [Bacteriovoracales bacterium]